MDGTFAVGACDPVRLHAPDKKRWDTMKAVDDEFCIRAPLVTERRGRMTSPCVRWGGWGVQPRSDYLSRPPTLTSVPPAKESGIVTSSDGVDRRRLSA